MSIDKHHGKWRYRLMKGGLLYQKGGFDTKDEAIIAEAQIRRKATQMNLDFVVLCESRLKDLKMNRSEKHFKENKQLIKNLIAKGWREKRTITRQDVQEFLNEVAKESKKMANKRLRLIKALFNHSIEREFLDHNPCTGIKPFSVTPKKRYVPPKKHIEAVIANADGLKSYLLTIKNTLGRASEIDNLTWEDVNLEERWLILSTRKAKNSDLTSRKLNINDELLEVLEGLSSEDLVFPYPEGINVIYWHRFRLLTEICERLGIKPFGFHAFRHYGASKLAEAGVPLTEIQTILGHQRPTTTDAYLRTLRPNLKSAMELL